MSADHDPVTSHPSTPSESPGISPAMRTRLQRCFERGKALTAKDKPDRDYAHTMFAECVINDPANLIYLEALLDNLQRKYGHNKKGARLMGFGGRGGLKKAAAKKEWTTAFREGMEALRYNPWDIPTLRLLAEACEENHYNEVELRYLKNALDANPRDIDVNRHCARSLARMGQFDQAIHCWHRVEELNRGDEEAPRVISELTLARARGASGVDKESGTASAATPSPPAAAPAGRPQQPTEPPAPAREPQLTPRQQLEQTLQREPMNLANYLLLAELHVHENRFRDAERVLNEAVSAVGHDLRVIERLEDVRLIGARAQLKIAEKRAAAEKTDEAAELVTRMRSELLRREIEHFHARCQRYPDQPRLRFELGLRLRKAGNYAEAMKYLQEALADAGCKPPALLEIGECQQQCRQYEKALGSYQAAVQAASEASDPCRKLALYRVGVLAAALQQLETAERYLDELVRADAQFKDAAARLDKVRKIRHKG